MVLVCEVVCGERLRRCRVILGITRQKLLISIEGLRDFIFVVPCIDPNISGWN
jgi:hypothetical protein